MPLTESQVQTIKATVPVVKEHGNTITSLFYKNLLSDAPSLNSVFNTANQANGNQAKALAGALYAYAANIDDLSPLAPTVKRINQKHVSLYVQPEQYDVVGKYLLQAMGQVLGEAFTQDIQEAWAAAYGQLADLMKGREAELYKQAAPWTNWRDFKISDKVQESSETTSFSLSPIDDKPLPSYKPGQYISICTSLHPSLDYHQARQYPLNDAPDRSRYQIKVKKVAGLDIKCSDAKTHQGYVSNILCDQKDIGDVVQISHPAGIVLSRYQE